MEVRQVEAGALERFTREVALALGAGPAAAAEVARHLVGANLAGHDSHGVLRLPQYVDLAAAGSLVPGAEPELLRSSPVLALFDGHRGFGQHACRAALDWCLDAASTAGIAAVAVRHSTHAGRMGEYVELAAARGLVGIATLGLGGPGAGTVAPFGGTGRFFGTNPWAIGIPVAGRDPFVMDFATSALAEGKVRLARAAGVPVAEGALLDVEGRPTTVAADLYAGGTLRLLGGDLAGHKGYGLSMAAALLGSLAIVDDEAATPAGAMSGPPPGDFLAGVLLAAIDPGWFGGRDGYARLAARMAGELEAAPPAAGVERVLVPGEPEARSRRRRRAEGIPLAAATARDLDMLAGRFGVAPPW